MGFMGAVAGGIAGVTTAITFIGIDAMFGVVPAALMPVVGGFVGTVVGATRVKVPNGYSMSPGAHGPGAQMPTAGRLAVSAPGAGGGAWGRAAAPVGAAGGEGQRDRGAAPVVRAADAVQGDRESVPGGLGRGGGGRPGDRMPGRGGEKPDDRMSGGGGGRPGDRMPGRGGEKPDDRMSGGGGDRPEDRISGGGGRPGDRLPVSVVGVGTGHLGGGGVGGRMSGGYVPPSVLPRPDVPEMPWWALPAVATAGVVAAVAVPYGGLGVGVVVAAVALGLAALPAVWRRMTWWTALFGLIGLVLVASAMVLDGDWLVAPLMVTGFCVLALAISGVGRSFLGVLAGGGSVLLAMVPLPWFLAPPMKALVRRRPAKLGHITAGIGLSLGLVVVFGALFASADAVFSKAVTDLLTAPGWLESVPVRVFTFAVFAVLVAASVLAGLRPVAEPKAPQVSFRVGRMLWVLPLIALNLLFAAFVAVQVRVLFGGDTQVLSTAGLTYAEYARQGFFQLVVVSVFVLAILAVAAGTVSVRGGDRWLMAALLGVLCALTMVILVSALERLGLYTEVYGLTRLRASVGATILWLGTVFALVVVAGAVRLARGSGGWLPRTLVAVTGLGLIAFAVWNPDLRVAETQLAIRGVERLDSDYLGDLGAEAVSALDRLPEPERSCVLADVVRANGLALPDQWNGWNLARERARTLLAEHPVIPVGSCPRPDTSYGRGR
jgi:hypothetical protein